MQLILNPDPIYHEGIDWNTRCSSLFHYLKIVAVNSLGYAAVLGSPGYRTGMDSTLSYQLLCFGRPQTFWTSSGESLMNAFLALSLDYPLGSSGTTLSDGPETSGATEHGSTHYIKYGLPRSCCIDSLMPALTSHSSPALKRLGLSASLKMLTRHRRVTHEQPESPPWPYLPSIKFKE